MWQFGVNDFVARLLKTFENDERITTSVIERALECYERKSRFGLYVTFLTLTSLLSTCCVLRFPPHSRIELNRCATPPYTEWNRQRRVSLRLDARKTERQREREHRLLFFFFTNYNIFYGTFTSVPRSVKQLFLYCRYRGKRSRPSQNVIPIRYDIHSAVAHSEYVYMYIGRLNII